MQKLLPVLIALTWLNALPLAAETASLVRPKGIFADRGPMLGARTTGPERLSPASLFAGHSAAGFFAPRAARPAALPRSGVGGVHSSGFALHQIVRLRDLIQQAESRRDGYDAVQHGARIKTPRPPTQMTIGEIDRWIRDTPGQPHAIGRYQFIPVTLRRLVKLLDVPDTAHFSPELQDFLADQLLREAGLEHLRAGLLTRHGFMNNLARIWAGFPTSSGRSHYHGYAGNKASITWARFDAHMADIFAG